MKNIRISKHLKKSTKISVYRAVVLTTLLYGSECWVAYRHHLRLMERFHQRCLRSILEIHWSNFVTNVEVVEKAEFQSIEAMLLRHSCIRLVMSTGWRTTDYLRSPCMANFLLASEIEGGTKSR